MRTIAAKAGVPELAELAINRWRKPVRVLCGVLGGLRR
jgi:hypothetical protein